MCVTPEVKLCVGLRNQDRAMATAQNPTERTNYSQWAVYRIIIENCNTVLSSTEESMTLH